MLKALPETLTGEQVARAIERAHITTVLHHDCGGCGHWVRYRIEPNGVFFDANCNCGSWSSLRRESFQDIADWYNMQRNDSAKKEIAERIGLRDEDQL